MQINTLQSVYASQFFSEFQLIKELFLNGDGYSFSWGGNNHTLVDVDTLVREISDRITIADETFDNGESFDDRTITVFCWNQFLAHVGNLPKGVYIDLEN